MTVLLNFTDTCPLSREMCGAICAVTSVTSMGYGVGLSSTSGRYSSRSGDAEILKFCAPISSVQEKEKEIEAG